MSFSGIRSRTLISVIPVGLLALSLVACSGPSSSEQTSTDQPSGGSSQSTCQVAAESINEVVESAKQQIPESIADGSFDPAELVDPVLKSLESAQSAATDPETLAAIDDVRTEWDGLVTDLQGLTPPDLSSLDALSKIAALKTYGDELSAVFTETLPALRESGSKLEEVCSAQ